MENRVWVYLSDKAFSAGQLTDLRADVEAFLKEWNAHGTSLESSFEILKDRFIIIRADEEKFSASGCSIDKQLRFIKEVEQKYGVSLLNRLLVAYEGTSGLKVVQANSIPSLLAGGELNGDTIVYNVGVGNDAEFKSSFAIPLKQSWLAKYLKPVM